jgi:nuclear transport factor 2 (NTF2) superfamily protein
MTEEKLPLPPFTRETAAQKVQAAEDAWNTRDPERVAQAYTVDAVWRNRDLFVSGRNEIMVVSAGSPVGMSCQPVKRSAA